MAIFPAPVGPTHELPGTRFTSLATPSRGSARPGDAVVVPAGVDFEIGNGGTDPLRMLCCLPVGGQARTAEATFTPPWAR